MNAKTKTDFPFEVQPSLDTALVYLRQTLGELPPASLQAANFRVLIDRIESAGSTPPDAQLGADLLHLLIGELGRTMTPAALMVPFVKQTIYADPGFSALMGANHDEGPKDIPSDLLGVANFEALMALHAYFIVLTHHYDFNLDFELSPLVCVTKADGTPAHYRMEMDYRCITLDIKGEKPVLNDADRALIIERPSDLALLQRLVPSKHFRFKGFLICRLREVTRDQMLVELRGDLTKVDSLTETNHLAAVEQRLQALLRKPDVSLTLAVLTDQFVFELHTQDAMCDYRGFRRSQLDNFNGTIFESIPSQRLVKVVYDLAQMPKRGAFEDELVSYGVRSVLGIPLILDDKVVGALVLSSPEPGRLTSTDVLNLSEVLPSFAAAVVRGLQQFESQVQSIIQERFTSIHESVEWKFRRLATEYLMNRRRDNLAGFEAGVGFDSVWPLYSVSDIRSSSTFRNEAIRADLSHQIGLAEAVVQAANAEKALPYLDELSFRLQGYLSHLHDGISSGDEIELLRFLSQEVEPAMTALGDFGPRVKAALSEYHGALHEEHHSVYEKRRDFDQSVSQINRAISSFVDRVQPEAQAMFPHYFDKNSTDGVDMNMYIGPELIADDSWQPLYLKNLRLWQLVVMAKIARLAYRVKSELPLPLQTTHLVVVQDMPISIRFSDDEKRFAVAGAYNIRYEIMKKRIDKATIKGTGERLTQPDQIAIVYSQHTERAEYERYIEFLQAKGFLEKQIDQLELDDLQGISGLRALRVPVRMVSEASDDEESIIAMIRRDFGG